jgi:membrane protease YdiL (CAAX protease family)
MPSRSTQTALFVAIALGGSYAIGAIWVTHPAWGWITQYLMWTPAVAALVLHAVRKEPPRAMGFGFTGAGAWLAALAYPFVVITACVVLGYAIRGVSGADVIHFEPGVVHGYVLGVDESGLGLVPLRLAREALFLAPWLALALAYRYRLPEKLGSARHVARAALWGGVFLLYPGSWWTPPGCIGEELGWRGWLIRVWRDRPATALVLSATVWAAFHLPVVVIEPPLHALVPALSFLLSVAAAAAAFEALYLWSGSIWPSAVAHFTWNFWNPFFLGNQYGAGAAIFGGHVWLINGEGLLGMLVNGAITAALFRRWRRAERAKHRVAASPGAP